MFSQYHLKDLTLCNVICTFGLCRSSSSFSWSMLFLVPSCSLRFWRPARGLGRVRLGWARQWMAPGSWWRWSSQRCWQFFLRFLEAVTPYWKRNQKDENVKVKKKLLNKLQNIHLLWGAAGRGGTSIEARQRGAPLLGGYQGTEWQLWRFGQSCQVSSLAGWESNGFQPFPRKSGARGSTGGGWVRDVGTMVSLVGCRNLICTCITRPMVVHR